MLIDTSHGTVQALTCLTNNWHAGVVTAGAAFAVNLGVENISGFKFWATFTIIEKGHYLGSFVVYTLINAALVLASVLVTLFIGPAAAGSGIADVKAGVELMHAHGYVAGMM